MTFDQVEKLIDLSYGKRVPQGLSEMMWCIPLAQYLNKKYGTTYDEVYKNDTLDRAGIDIVLSSNTHQSTALFIQLTHAREYDMSPNPINKEIDLTGHPIIEALELKCTHYMARGIDTHKMILIIQGILPQTYVYELMNEGTYRTKFDSIDCFDGIYYISDKVYPLKEVTL